MRETAVCGLLARGAVRVNDIRDTRFSSLVKPDLAPALVLRWVDPDCLRERGDFGRSVREAFAVCGVERVEHALPTGRDLFGTSVVHAIGRQDRDVTVMVLLAPSISRRARFRGGTVFITKRQERSEGQTSAYTSIMTNNSLRISEWTERLKQL